MICARRPRGFQSALPCMRCITPYARHVIGLCSGGLLVFLILSVVSLAHTCLQKAFARPADQTAGSAPARLGWPADRKEKKEFSVSSTLPRTGPCWRTETCCWVLSPLRFGVLSLWGEEQGCQRSRCEDNNDLSSGLFS